MPASAQIPAPSVALRRPSEARPKMAQRLRLERSTPSLSASAMSARPVTAGLAQIVCSQELPTAPQPASARSRRAATSWGPVPAGVAGGSAVAVNDHSE